MTMAQQETYGNSSISKLSGADRVRMRPAVIFGSDGLDGCEHSVFEIVSNSVDEAREGYGKQIIVTKYEDGSFEVEDFGRGVPVDFNPKEQCFNWELVYCELYAGGKYNNKKGQSYEYSLGTNGLGACATQYASEYMDVTVYSNHTKYSLHFEKGENIGGLKKEAYSGRRTGSIHRWKPDIAVFTDVNVPIEYFTDMMKRQAVVNPGITFVLRNQVNGTFETTEFIYQNGILDYVNEIANDNAIVGVQSWHTERTVRDREDKDEYVVKLNIAMTFSNKVTCLEYYHNSSWLEHGGAPEKAVMSAFVSQFDAYLRQQNKYNKTESKIKFSDIED